MKQLTLLSVFLVFLILLIPSVLAFYPEDIFSWVFRIIRLMLWPGKGGGGTPAITTSTTTLPCPPQSCQTLLDRVKSVYGSYCGHPRWDPSIDINKDGFVDAIDIVAVIRKCGDGNWCQSMLDNTFDACLTTSTTTTSTTSTSTTTSPVGAPITTSTTTLPCPPQSCQTLLDRVKSVYGSYCGHPRWDPSADINKDGFVDALDIVAVTRKCGDGDWCQNTLDNATDFCLISTTTTTSISITISPVGESSTTSTSTSTTVMSCPPQSCQTLLDRVKSVYGSYCGHPRWDPSIDINKDGFVDAIDIVAVIRKCGDGNWCQSMLINNTDVCPPTTTTTTTTLPKYCLKDGGIDCFSSSTGCILACKSRGFSLGMCEIGYSDCRPYDCCCFCANEITTTTTTSSSTTVPVTTSPVGVPETTSSSTTILIPRCGNGICETDENCNSCSLDCKCPVGNVCRPDSELADEIGCVNMKPTNYCIYECSKKYYDFLCRVSCSIVCGLGLC